jgi:muramidase (phage lysozyme)
LTLSNVIAFLRVIRAGETSQQPDAYRMMFGGSHFNAPPWEHPRQAITIGKLTSTAAGAYQFLSRTWTVLQASYKFDDFSPMNQDKAAVALIAGRGALQDVIDGRFQAAIKKCAKEWASLPGSPYGQPTRDLAQALETYSAFGGQIAEGVA